MMPRSTIPPTMEAATAFDELPEILSEISITFIDLPAEELDLHVMDALERIGQLIHVDRASLAQRVGAGQLQVSHAWCAEGTQAPRDVYNENHLPWIMSHLRAGVAVSIERQAEFPKDSPDRLIAEQEGVRSLLCLPLVSRSELIGVLTFLHLRQERVWPRALRKRLGLLADMFANALERKTMEIKRRGVYEEVTQLKERLETENLYLREELDLEYPHGQVVGRSSKLREVLRAVERVAPTDSAVLILGETGTGKELVANAIHAISPRRERPMIKVNCAALPSTLVESELFGRERGAYTGALTREQGRFEAADGSTILLDEIGDLSLDLQAKLLRVLQEGHFERLGSSKTITTDARVFAATHCDLPSMVEKGSFRKDLFFRLNVFPITVPPLRDRIEDIPPLVWAFIEEFGRTMGRSIERIPERTMKRLVSHAWPGNVRELRNVIERAMILNTGPVLDVDIPLGPVVGTAVPRTLAEVQRDQILRVLRHTAWRIRGKDGAAAILGLKPTTLESRMKRLGIARQPSPGIS